MDSGAASSLSRSSLESRAGIEVAVAAAAAPSGYSVRERVSRLERLVLGRASSDDRASDVPVPPECPDARDPAAFAWSGGGVRERAVTRVVGRAAAMWRRKESSNSGHSCSSDERALRPTVGSSTAGASGSGRRRPPGAVRLRPRQPPRSQCSARRRAIAAAHAAHNEHAVRAHGTHGPLAAFAPPIFRSQLASAPGSYVRESCGSASASEVPGPSSPPQPGQCRRHRDASDGGGGRVTGGVTSGLSHAQCSDRDAGAHTDCAYTHSHVHSHRYIPQKERGGGGAEGGGGGTWEVARARTSASSLASLSSDGGLREEISTSALIEFYERKARQARAAARRFVDRCERDHAPRDGICSYESEDEEEEDEALADSEERPGPPSQLEFTYVRRALSALRLLEEARVRWPRAAAASSSACACGSAPASNPTRRPVVENVPSPPRTAPPACVDRASSAVSFFDTTETKICMGALRVDRACSPFRRRSGQHDSASRSSGASSQWSEETSSSRLRHRRQRQRPRRRRPGTAPASSSSAESLSHAPVPSCYDDSIMMPAPPPSLASASATYSRSPSRCGGSATGSAFGQGSLPDRCGDVAVVGSAVGGARTRGSRLVETLRDRDAHSEPARDSPRCCAPVSGLCAGGLGKGAGPEGGACGACGVAGGGAKGATQSFFDARSEPAGRRATPPASSTRSSRTASTHDSRSESLSASEHGDRPRFFCTHLSRRESWTDSKAMTAAARLSRHPSPPPAFAGGASDDSATPREPQRKGKRIFASTPHLPPRREGYRRLRRRPPPRYKDSLRQFFEEAAFLSKMGIKSWNLQDSCCDIVLGSSLSKTSQSQVVQNEPSPEALKNFLDSFLTNLLFSK